jgi:serine/threonine protein kinase
VLVARQSSLLVRDPQTDVIGALASEMQKTERRASKREGDPLIQTAATMETVNLPDGEATENMLAPSQKISKDDFNFVKVVGRGSFGKVYLVKKIDNPKLPLAMKVLNKDVVAKRNLLIKTQGIFASLY